MPFDPTIPPGNDDLAAKWGEYGAFVDLIASPATQTVALAVALAALALTVVRRDAVAYRRNA